MQVIDFYSGYEGEKEIILYADNMELHMWDGDFSPIMDIALYKEVEVCEVAFGVVAEYQTLTGWCDIHAKKTIVEHPKKELEILLSIDIEKELKQQEPSMSDYYKADVVKVYYAMIDFYKQAVGTIYIEEQ